MYAATGGPKVKKGGSPISNGVPGTTGSPAGDDPVWLDIWNYRPGCFYN